MADVKVIVNVVDEQLSKLEKRINDLSKKTIKIKVETNEIQRFSTITQKATEAVKNVSSAATSAEAGINSIGVAASSTAADVSKLDAAMTTLITNITRGGQYSQASQTTSKLFDQIKVSVESATQQVNEFVTVYKDMVRLLGSGSGSGSGSGNGGGNGGGFTPGNFSPKLLGGGGMPLVNINGGMTSSGGSIANSFDISQYVQWKIVPEIDISGVTSKLNEAASALSGSFNGIFDALERRMMMFARQKFRQAINEALAEMKRVDDELVVVRKVSQASADEIQAYQERAYETAKQYGVAASDYLASVASFVRAGYRENAGDLAELSIKTQLVGDVTEEVADQFLLSTDKAYQFNGSIQDLNRVLDSANEIDNKYATSIDKIASGMGIVAPVAAQMHVGVDELMASIGTITAVTQRTGTEAARALRAIFLNIVGDTKTEIDEGVTWTTGEIAGLRDVLKKYVPDLVEEADLKGKIIDPMRAIEGLSKAMKEGLLSEQELMSMVSDIGGKLRSSQLLALIQNWDMYSSMLEDIGGAAGSADREVANALDSWTRKSEILKATWTEFINDIVDTDQIKNFLDRLREIVEFLQDHEGIVKTILAGIVAIEGYRIFDRAITGAKMFMSALKPIVGAVKELVGLIAEFGFKEVIGALGETAGGTAAGAVGSVAAPILGIAGLYAGMWGIAAGAKNAGDKKAQAETDAVVEETNELIAAYQNALEKGNEFKKAMSDLDKNLGTTDDIDAATDAYYQLAYALGYTKVQAERLMEGKSLSEAGEQLLGNATNRAELEARHSAARSRAQIKNQLDEKWVSAVGQLEEGGGMGNASETLRTWVESTKASYEHIDSLEEMSSYYNRLIKLKEMFEEEGVKNDTYYAILEDIKELTPYVENYNAVQQELIDTEEALAAANEEAAASFGDPIKSLNILDDALAKATGEIEEYNNAISGGEKGDTLNTYKGIYDTAMEHFEAGEVGSTQFQNAMQLLLPDSVLREIEYDYEKAGEIASSKYFQALMKSTDDGGAEFANQLYDLWEEGANGIQDAMRIIDDGEGGFEIVIDDYEKLGEIMQIDSEVLAAWSDQIDIFNAGLNLSRDDIIEMAKSAGALTESAGGWEKINVGKFFDQIIQGGSEAGKSAQEIESDLYNAASELKNLNDVELTGPPQEIDALRDSASKSIDEIVKVRDQMQETGDEESTPTVTLDHTVFDAQLQIVNDKLDRLASRKVTVGASIQQKAEGTDHAEGGLALTGELGPELVQESTGARIVGLDGPEMTILEEGAKVYTAEETQAILNRKGSTKIPTFWKGGTFTRASAATTAAKASGATRKSGASSSSSKSKTKTTDDLTDAQKEQIKKHQAIVDLLESELDLLEAQNKPTKDQVAKIKEIQNSLMDQIKYMESIKADQTDINKLYVEWYKWQDQIAKLQKEVYKDLDDAIDNELDELKDYYDDQKDAIDEQIDALKEARDTKEDELDLDEKLLAVEEARANLANAQAERTVRMYNAQTGQWEWVANAKNVQSAQEALQKAEEDLAKYYEDAAYDAQVAALEAQKDALDDEFDSIKEKWQEILDALEEPAKSLEEVLSDIAKNATADMQEEIDALNAMLAQFGYMIPLKGGTTVYQTSAKKYDSGGVLSGLGGIKATPLAEGVLPPDLTAAMLSPQSNEVFAQRLSELRYLYGANGMPTMLSGGGNRIGSQHNGNVYTFGNITLSEAQARSTTVYELAQRSRNLALYRNVN